MTAVVVAADDEFVEAFHGLAKHLFPDGCPDQSLESVWPHYDRTPAPFTDAMDSYEQVVQLQRGLSSLQTHAMIVTTLALLPHSTYKGPFATITYFNKTLHAIVPCANIPPRAVERLLSGVTVNEAGRCAVLQFLYLSVAYGCVELEYIEKRYYSFFMHWSLQAETCQDAVRLLLCMSPQPRYLRRLLQQKESTPGLASLSLLLQHYTGVATDLRVAFSNREWEQSFQRFHKRIPFIHLSWSDLDHAWQDYQLSRAVATGVKRPTSATHSQSVWMERWFHGDEMIQRELLEPLMLLSSSSMEDVLIQRVLPLWDGRDPELFLHALPLQRTVLPYLERHFRFGSSAVQYAIGDYLLRYVEDEKGSDAKVVFFVNDLLLRTLLMNCSAVVVYIAFDVLDRGVPPDPALLYRLGWSGVSWERFGILMTRYKNENEKGMDRAVLDEIIGNIRKVLSGGPDLVDLFHQTSIQERLAHILMTRTNTSHLDDLSSGTSELVEAIRMDWPEADHFLAL